MNSIFINNKGIGNDFPTYIIAEMSGNHNGDLNRALAIVDAAADAGADAIKLQTYTADTITLDCDSDLFRTQKGGLWEGGILYDLYKDAYTPWEWHDTIMKHAKERNLDFFSTPFDFSAIDFLEKLNVPAYKIASYEIRDLPLIMKAAKTGKPIMMSTGIATLSDIDSAVGTCKTVGNDNFMLLKCVSEYPSPYEDMNIRVIPHMQQMFGCPCGLSDHSLGCEVSIAAVSIGAKIIEKHLTLSREDGGVDSAFSMEPKEFKSLVDGIRNVEKALGRITYDLTDKQIEGRTGGRSLFVSRDIYAGEIFTEKNIRSVRPAAGIAPKYYYTVLGHKAKCDLKMGTPLNWKHID